MARRPKGTANGASHKIIRNGADLRAELAALMLECIHGKPSPERTAHIRLAVKSAGAINQSLQNDLKAVQLTLEAKQRSVAIAELGMTTVKSIELYPNTKEAGPAK
jgi:hypothetical protein